MRNIGRVQPGTVLGIIALVFASAGGAYAAATVGTDDIESRAVTGSKIAPGAVKTSKVKDNAITGQKVDESSLGQVPSAQRADVATTAQGIEGENEFFIKMGFGEDRLIGSNGQVSLTASCDRSGGNDTLTIFAYSEQDGAMLKSNFDNLLGQGAGGFLGPNTPPDNRVFFQDSAPTGQIQGFFALDGGWVSDPNERILAIDTETLFLAVNYYGQPGCVLAGELQTYQS